MQFDVYGNLFGLLAAHPVAPLVSMHHLDVVDPIFPNTTRVEALQRLTIPMNLDSAGLIQQSICYEEGNTWTISVSWGYAVQIFRGIMSPREVERRTRTFLSWYKRADFTSYTFNTRAVVRIPCQKSYVFFLESARLNSFSNETVTVYAKHHAPHPACKWKTKSPRGIEKVVVYKKPDPHLWDRVKYCSTLNIYYNYVIFTRVLLLKAKMTYAKKIIKLKIVVRLFLHKSFMIWR